MKYFPHIITFLLLFSHTAFSQWNQAGNIISNNPLTDSVGIGLNTPSNLFQVKDLIEFNPTYSGTFIGDSAGINNTGIRNTFIGYYSGLANTTGKQNVFVGYLSGTANTTGFNNVFIGQGAGENNIDGASNTFIGRKAGKSNTSGTANTFIGKETGFANTTGTNNTAFGTQALRYNVTGSYNTAYGNNSLQSSTSCDSNVVFGFGVLKNAYTFKRNVVMGFQAANSASAISGCVIIGNEAGFYNTVSNRLMIDNSNTNTPLLDGDFANNVLTINDVLKLAPRSSAPSSPTAGMIYFDSTDNKLKVYDGTAWQACW